VFVEDEPVVVVLTGDSDDATDLRLLLVEAVLAGAPSIIVDASRLEDIPSPAITAMLTAHRACRRRAGQLVLRDPSRRALNQLRRNGLRDVLAIESRSATFRSADVRERA
jgi:anti-anti-sigma regulatory factor